MKMITRYDKIIGINYTSFKSIYKHFNYILIEADGSKIKSIKGWKDNEPIVYNKTDKTIGVLDITTIGIKINQYIIHRLQF